MYHNIGQRAIQLVATVEIRFLVLVFPFSKNLKSNPYSSAYFKNICECVISKRAPCMTATCLSMQTQLSRCCTYRWCDVAAAAARGKRGFHNTGSSPQASPSDNHSAHSRPCGNLSCFSEVDCKGGELMQCRGCGRLRWEEGRREDARRTNT